MKKLNKTLTMLVAVLLVVVMAFAACKPETPDNPTEPTVESIAVDTTGAKTVFAYGEKFSTDGLKVTATMSDGTTKDVPLADCQISTPEMTKPGTRSVAVRYEGKSTRYTITVNERIMPKISETSLADINKENIYKVEAENIDLAISNVAKKGGELVVDDENVSGGKYVANYGVAGNYFGFTFTADKTYEDVIIVWRLANPSTSSVLSMGETFNAYLNYKTVSETGMLDIAPITTLNPATVVAGEEGEDDTVTINWSGKALRGVTIPQGTNTLTFEVLGDNQLYIDYIAFYVGMPFSGDSKVEITEKGDEALTMEFEDFNLEKIVNRQDMINAHGLKPGQCFVEPAQTNTENTSKGTSAAGFTTGTEISTTLVVGADATVKFIMKAANVSSYKIKDNWHFYIDGIELLNVEDLDIRDGDATQNQYWQWKDTNLGIYNLTAGEHLFTAALYGTHCNVDTFSFEVVSYGSFDPSGVTPEVVKHYDAELSADGIAYVEAENLLGSNDITMRGDQSSLTEGWNNDLGSGECLKGFVAGTTLNISFKLANDAKVALGMRMSFYDGAFDMANLEVTLDGQAVTATSDSSFGHNSPSDYWRWGEVSFGEHDLTEGDHVLTVKFVVHGMNVDRFSFNVNPGSEPAHVCTSKCETCGKCTNESCTEEVCQTKCEGHEPINNATIELSDNGIKYVEAENIDKSNITLRGDQSSFTEGWNNDFGSGECFKGFVPGTTIRIKITAASAMKVALGMRMSNSSGAYDFTQMVVTIDNTTLTASSDSTFGMGPNGNDWWYWGEVSFGTVELTEGDHVLSITFNVASVNIDRFSFNVNPEEEAEQFSNAQITLSKNGTSYVEAESVDNSNIEVRADLAAVGQTKANLTENWSNDLGSGACLRGFAANTTITIKITTASDLKVALGMRMSNYDGAYDMSNLEIKLDGQTLTATTDSSFGNQGAGDYWRWGEVSFGEADLTAGDHFLTITFKVTGINVDRFSFDVTSATEAE